MITAFAHACLGLSDLKEAERFFCTVLGLKKRFDFTKKGEVIGFYLHVTGNSFIEVFKGTNEAGAKPGVIRHLCLETDDIDGIIRSLQQHGYPVGKKSMGCDQSWQVWVKGPDGLDIEFHHYTPASCQLTGKSCEVNW
jgi:catechol 2,3-dioxygenase-like lactoylglutathione lyase family enzyme